MKLAKRINDALDFVDCENGAEVGGTRTEQDLYADGYKKACPYLGGETGDKVWKEYPECWAEELMPQPPVDEPDVADLPDDAELTDAQALQIIIGQ